MSTEEPEIAGSGIDSDYRCNSEGKGSMVVGRDPLDFEIDLQVDKIWAREYVQSTRFELSRIAGSEQSVRCVEVKNYLVDEESDDEIDMIGFEFDITPLGTLKKSPAFKRDLSSSQRLNLSYGKQTTLVKQLTGLSEDESSFNDEEKESQNFGKSSIHFSKGSFISKNPNDKEIILAGRLSEVVEEKKKFFDLEKDGISGSSSESLGDWDAEIEEEEKNSGSFKAPPLSISDLKNGTMFKDFLLGKNVHKRKSIESRLPTKWKLLDSFLTNLNSLPSQISSNSSEIDDSKIDGQELSGIFSETSVQCLLEKLCSKFEDESEFKIDEFELEELQSLAPNTCTQSFASWLSNASAHIADALKADTFSSNSNVLWSKLTFIFRELSSFRGKLLPESDFYERIHKQLVDLLRVGAERANPSRELEFNRWIVTCSKLLPAKSEYYSLIELSSMAHNNSLKVNHVLRGFVQMYHRHKDISCTKSLELAAFAVASLSAYIGGSSPASPLDCGPLQDIASWDPESDQFEWLEAALRGERPKRHLRFLDSDLEIEALMWELCGSSDVRLSILQTLYLKLSPRSFYRSFVASVLSAIYFHFRSDSIIAERLAFESLFVLNELSAEPNNFPPIKSTFTQNTLVLYADAALASSKYRFGILALEAAARCYQARTYMEFHALYRKLADICSENEDWERALFYHKRIMDRAQKMSNVNETVYSSQQICRISIELGDFSAAEYALVSTLQYLDSASGNDDAHYNDEKSAMYTNSPDRKNGLNALRTPMMSMFLKLVQLYVDANKFDSAVKILHYVISSGLAKSRIPALKLMLIKIMIKKGSYSAAEEYLKEFDVAVGEDALNWKSPPSHSRARSHSEIEFFGSAGITYIEISKSVDFFDLKVRLLIHTGNCDLAISIAENIIKRTSSSNFRQLARFHYLKAKALRRRLLSFLDSFASTSDDLFVDEKYLEYKDCVMSYTIAYENFSKANDSYRGAKALISIGETYLDFLFHVVTVLGVPLLNLRRWLFHCNFDVSLDSSESACRESLRRIEQPTKTALDFFSRHFDVMSSLRCLLTMSTVKLLKSEIELSLLFWTEARNLFFSVFMNQLFFPFFGLLSRSAMEKVESIFKRLISILFCFDVFIIDQNIQTIDSFILFQSELSLFRRGEKRSSQLDAGETFDFEDDDSGSGSGSSSANEDSDPSSFGNNSAPSSVAFLTDSRSSKTSSSSSTVRFKKKLASAPSLFSRRLSWLKMTSSHAAKEPKLDSITATLEFNFTPMKKLDEVDSHFDLERVLLQRISARFFLLSKNLKHYDSSNHSLAELLNKCKSAFLGIIRDMQILRHSSQDHGYFLSYKPEKISPTFPETSPSDEMTNFLHLNSSELEMKNPSWSNLFYFTVLNSHTVIGYHPASKQKIFSFLPSVSCNENSASSVAIIDLVNLFGTLKANAVVSPLNFSDIHAIEDLIHSTLDLNEREPSKSRNSPSSMSFMKDAAFRSASRTDLSTPESYMNVFNLPFGYRLAEESLKIPILDIESVNILFSVLDTSNVLILLTILFAEWRVIIFSQSQTLSQVVVHSIFGLLYPFSWQHIYVPLLPKEGASILLLPCPYIISMHSSLKNEVCVPNGVAVIDLDHNKIAYPSGKIPAIPVDYKQKMLKAFSRYQEQAMLPISVRNFPSDLLSYSISGRSNISYDSYVHPSLRRLSYNVIAMRLHDNVSSENTEGIVSLQILQDNILQIFASLFYRYRLFLKDDSDSPFDVGAFISHVREEIVGFMDFFVRTKMFFDFIRTRIEARMSDIDDTRFEHYVLRNIVHKYSFIRSHDLKDLKGSWYVLKGRSWKKRYVSLIRSVFTVHKSKRLQKYIKLQIDLSPTSYTIDSACPIEDASGKWFYVTIKAMNGDSPSSVLRMRCVSPAIQTEWIDAMNSRVLDLDIRHAYNELSKKISHPISRI